MTDAAAAGDAHKTTVWAVTTGVVVAGYLALQQVMYTVERMTQVVLTAEASTRIDATLARLDPLDIAAESVQAEARGAREAITEGKAQLQATSVLSLAFALLVGFAGRHGAFGLLTQEFGRYEMTVRENLLLATDGRDRGDERLWDVLRAARAAEFVERLDGGLDAALGEQWGGSGLSDGQWQRLALARLMLRDAPAWILDEPTSAIDAEAEEQIFTELRRIGAGHVTIVVSHRAWTLRHADRIHVIDDGRIVESGGFDDLMRSDGRFTALFATQRT